MDRQLSGKVAVITGASSGIGRATARALAAEIGPQAAAFPTDVASGAVTPGATAS